MGVPVKSLNSKLRRLLLARSMHEQVHCTASHATQHCGDATCTYVSPVSELTGPELLTHCTNSHTHGCPDVSQFTRDVQPVPFVAVYSSTRGCRSTREQPEYCWETPVRQLAVQVDDVNGKRVVSDVGTAPVS